MHSLRFSSKVKQYTRYRWNYAPEAIAWIFAITQCSRDIVVADIGSGTGMLTEHFINKVRRIFAIEPNRMMREVAEKNLGQYSSFFSIDGLSDATGLADKSVDLITIARAIHWFPSEATKKELQRIIKPDGWLVIMDIRCTNEDLINALNVIRTEENGWDTQGDKYRLNNLPLSFYYGNENYLTMNFEDGKTENWDDFMGRLSSISSCPAQEHPLYDNFEKAAREVFNLFSADGDRLIFNIATQVNLGQIND
ncbi:class I SAM-dependent methyltransferase [Cronbergia sp. UHCC 0137]|uniref:class I SAM-dependent methyltransferase n=1 Tax=Cronbergia sp. UHCC 0137 TaxID=3110239 RepID=UPI002B2116F5|nr:class I SAM-dependent methyltransferase [Cronbergia sp. UHCC 0137]MEA5617988.1 class I SAM-dependent methyltransferase [Cronbergia sp. UHCC 0137]